jgi:hypothetical protein
MIGSSVSAPGEDWLAPHVQATSALSSRSTGGRPACDPRRGATALAAWPYNAVDAVLPEGRIGASPRSSTKMVDVAHRRDTTIWDHAGDEPRRGGDPVDFVFDTALARPAAKPLAVARLRPLHVSGGDAIDIIFAGDRLDT